MRLAVLVIVLALVLVFIGVRADARTSALITIRAVNYRVVEGRTPGSDALYTSLLYNYRVSFNPIGHATLICTFIGRGGPLGSGTSECMGTFVIPRGKIVVSGSRKSRSYYVLAVVGGTGLYSDARGQLIAATRGMPEGQQRLVFSLE